MAYSTSSNVLSDAITVATSVVTVLVAARRWITRNVVDPLKSVNEKADAAEQEAASAIQIVRKNTKKIDKRLRILEARSSETLSAVKNGTSH